MLSNLRYSMLYFEIRTDSLTIFLVYLLETIAFRWPKGSNIQYLYNIGWHWGLYENILDTPWMISKEAKGEFFSLMASAVYCHTTPNKAIQYYHYYIIWSWLCSEILTILIHIVFIYTLKATSLTQSFCLSTIPTQTGWTTVLRSGGLKTRCVQYSN